MASNFHFLAHYWPGIADIGAAAETHLHVDANACVVQLSLLAERIVMEIISFEKLQAPAEATQSDRIRILRREGALPKKIEDILLAIRKARNEAVHTGLSNQAEAETLLRMAYHLSCWFMEVYGDWKDQSADFAVPENTAATSDYAELLKRQEKRIGELSEQIAVIQTAASEKDVDERTKKAEEAALTLELTDAETQYLLKEQIRIEFSTLSVVNYALQQNRIPVVRSLFVVNNSDTALENIDIRISSTPQFCLPACKHLDCVPAGSTYEVRDIRVSLDSEYLARLTEKETGLLHIALTCDDTTLCSEDVDITALAFDEWHGYGFYPELVTAFVTPNHPEVTKITADAAKLLGQWTGDPSLDGYQSNDPSRVLAQAGAVFGALQKQDIIYAVHPASFEKVGQRIRLCDAVMHEKMGNCLDLTLLYTACLEAIGLKPLLILKNGHIFSGVWLDDLSFPEAVQDDASLITKRLADGVNEIAVVETTMLTSGKNATFDDARLMAEQELVGQDPVEYIIDVARARLSGTSPLPLRVRTEQGYGILRESLTLDVLPSAPLSAKETIELEQPRGEERFSKKTQWERKLLDLGLRNALINLRLSKTLIPILASSLDELENTLSDGCDLSIHPRPLDWQLHSGEIGFETMHDLGSNAGVIQSEFRNHRLRAALTEAELAKTQKGLYRSAKAALEENGANTLYLALGLLRWYESKRSTKPRYAPLILLPVDMVRKSAAQGYVIRLRDDEPQMNITLLEMLKQEFAITISGVDPLPLDGHGIDIRRVFTIMRKAVMGQARWDVLESAYLGIFSFSQFVMWNDMRNRSEDLAKNKIVRSLMDSKLSWDAQGMEIGARVPEDNVFLPLPADASQLYAIEAACKGESFVLHGPPGTGKSQTITALIANALAQGKTVLFVAEKMAALEVVNKRLDSIGIGPFCLELHSNKAKKKTVLEQLRLATEVIKNTTAEAYGRKADQLHALRQELDSYAAVLHAKNTCGLSVYELIGGYENDKDAADIAAFEAEFASNLTAERLDEQCTIVERMIAAAKAVGHPYNHPLTSIGCTQYSQQLRNQLPTRRKKYRNALDAVQSAARAFADALHMPLPSTFTDLEKTASIAEEFIFWMDAPKAWGEVQNASRYFSEVQEMAQHYENAAILQTRILTKWTPEFLTQNGGELLAEYRAIASKWFLPKLLGMNSFVKRVAPFSISAITKDTLETQLTALAEYQSERAAGDALFAGCGDDMDSLYLGEHTDWPKVKRMAHTAQESARRLNAICGSNEIRLAHAGDKSIHTQITSLNAAWAMLTSAKQDLYGLLVISSYCGDEWIEHEKILCDQMQTHEDSLKEWITWNSISQKAAAAGLQNVVDAYCSGLEHGSVLPAYKKAIFRALASCAIDRATILNQFSGAMFHEKIEQLKRMDRELMDLTQQEIYCRLASRVPDFTKEAAHSSEVGILQRAIRSGGRGVSIRRIFEQIPNLLPRLCPCMLMSPISAAQYLEPGREPFDIVVFDEASQLPTCKAVGALARAKDAIIVGDPKQMPPTSFFASNTVDEDNLESEDLESILDDCLALNMPQTHLLWHYRSRHESLIAFSNSRFYENKLYTFPSVNDRESKVSLVHINGVFERGRTRQNRAEAEAIVAELIRRCHDRELAQYSVGVVTFNISQQNLIDDLLTEACAADAELERWIYESAEPVFIKNLENVQGDERDVILFSIGYGPDENGKVYMNFGPLNREGGWRRLNVAISRSRVEMIVFSTLTPDQINLSRTSAEGVAALKAFLEYAGGQKLAQDETAIRYQRDERMGIARAICKALHESGYETQLDIGHSEYRIDIGVVDPVRPDQYILGILLDGKSYGTAKTTRDREIAQISVLRGLGWTIHRIWSMDWWDNSKKEIDKLLSKLNDCHSVPRIKADEEKAAAKAQPPVKESQALERNTKVPRREKSVSSAEETSGAPVYTPAKLTAQYVSADAFLLPNMAPAIREKVSLVLAAEAPISEGALTRRVVQSFDIARAGSRIQGRMRAVYRSMHLKKTEQDGVVFYWNADQNPDAYDGCRATGIDDAKRDAKDVPVQEAANAICRVLDEQIGLSQEDLIREAAKRMGYTRSGSVVSALFTSAIACAAKKNRIRQGANGNWIMTE